MPFIITGKKESGKTSLINFFLEETQNNKKIIRCNTRNTAEIILKNMNATCLW